MSGEIIPFGTLGPASRYYRYTMYFPFCEDGKYVIDRDNFLFMEPPNPASVEPDIDQLTRLVTTLLRGAKEVEPSYKGMHCCACGALSGCCDLALPNGQKANTLAVHYVAHHRASFGRGDIARALVTLNECKVTEESEPTLEELWPGKHR